MKSYYTYILKCSDSSFYTGMTNDFERRLEEHTKGLNKECYTFNKRPIELVWFETFTNPDEAIKTEKQIKGWSRRKKIALIEEDYDRLIEYSKSYTQFGNKINKGD